MQLKNNNIILTIYPLNPNIFAVLKKNKIFYIFEDEIQIMLNHKSNTRTELKIKNM